jgi:hypothetical protein
LAFGNVALVDQVNGNDATAAVNLGRFKTVQAALTSAGTFGAPATVYILPGNYDGPFVIPSFIGVRGMDVKGVTLQLLGVAGPTDLITMGESCRIEDMTLRLTSSVHTTLRAIVMPGTSNVTSALRVLQCFVDNSSAPSSGSSDVVCIACIGTGSSAPGFQTARGSSFTTTSAGAGSKRCVLVSSSAGFRSRDCNFIVNGSTGPTGGTWYGVETSTTGASFTTRASTISSSCPTGASCADISQTSGIISISSTNLLSSNANGLGFTCSIAPPSYLWSDPGNLPNGTNYLRPGTANSTTTEAQILVSQKCLIKSLTVVARVAPGVGSTSTFTVRKNGVNTLLTTSLAGTNAMSQNLVVSVSFAMSDKISVQVVNNGTNTSDVVVTVDFY